MRRRALTLIEVVAATVLLASIAAATLPIVRSGERVHTPSVRELEALLDRVIEHGEDLPLTSSGLWTSRLDDGLFDGDVPGHDQHRSGEVELMVVPAKTLGRPNAPGEPFGAWLVATAPGATAVRWLDLPADVLSGVPPRAPRSSSAHGRSEGER